MNKINRKLVGKELFDQILDDIHEFSYKEHRRGSSFFVKSIFFVDDLLLPDNPELWGFWESNQIVWDDDYGYENSEITELTRVEKKEKTIVVEEWVEV